ncbi:MAG: 3-deoxy-7-phosphoheptulonate synthase [Elusimicrobia bacterium]|nr:3-deoxy-7-phosphoheptulonate synthase [Elusimicrobiota bacterium]
MLVLFQPDVRADGPEVKGLLAHLEQYPGIAAQVHSVQGSLRSLTEVYLIGPTDTVSREGIESLPGVERVVRISEKYRLIGRHRAQVESLGFAYNGVRFEQDSFHVFAGLCAVDNRENVAKTMKALNAAGLETTRMGAYKPRTSPYDFQGHGAECLPYVFELAGENRVKVVAMEVVHESQLSEIRRALEAAGRPTGVMVQIGTRNAQNFELLKQIGQQKEFPVLFKRGMGITLEESLNACEYVASEGNRNIVFCLRGVKSHLGDPHRNLVDFAHVPVVKRLTRMPVCVDPSHSVGRREKGSDGLSDLQHAAAQGVIAGANMVLVDFHPEPACAWCDGPQAMPLEELPWFLEDLRVVREAYERRRTIASTR